MAKTFVTVAVTHPNDVARSTVVGAVMHALDDPNHYPDDMDIRDWTVEVRTEVAQV